MLRNPVIDCLLKLIVLDDYELKERKEQLLSKR